MAAHTLDRLVLEGYKSIAQADLELRSLNVLVGPNGAGKSNLISAFGLLGAIVNGSLQVTVARAGGASTLLHGGPKVTTQLRLHGYFGANQYEAVLIPTANDELVFERETMYYHGPGYARPWNLVIGQGTRESNLAKEATGSGAGIARHCLTAMKSWRVFHFHDTSPQAGVKQKQPIGDNAELRADASNLAAFLYRLREAHPAHFGRIVDSIRLVAPFFDNFNLYPDRVNPDRIQLEWREVGSDDYYNAHALSDGTLRYMCLSTLLLQPDPPSVIIIDEPELGLHPAAITQLAEVFRSVAVSRQLIVSTQSVTLLNQMGPEDVLITEHVAGATRFLRPDSEGLAAWLQEYAIGELWEKNVLGGRPHSRTA